MFLIRKKFSFSAAHHLEGLAPEHPCSRPHGHNYEVEVVLASRSPDKIGFVRDYRELNEFKDFIDNYLDHRDLNEVWTDMNPTAENIAWILFLRCKGLWPETYSVLVSETPKTWAEYRSDGI